MTNKDLQILYTALGYVLACLVKPESPDKAEPAIIYAANIEEYVRDYVQDVFPVHDIRFVNDSGVDEIDAAVDRHMRELRDSEMTILPQDKDTLLKYYDRLQQRRSRRTQADFYELVEPAVLANRVLTYLDEEIREMGETL